MNKIRFVFFLVVVGIVSYLLLFTPEGARLLSTEGRKVLLNRIDLLVTSAGGFGPVLFVLIYATGVLALPATPFSAAGALIFGKYFGALANVVGATLGATISFCLGRYFLRDFAKGYLIGKLEELDRKSGEHGFSIIFYLRILWFPFIVLNYAAGATNIRFSDYLFGTFFGILPSIIIVSVFFGSIREIMANFHDISDLLQVNILVPVSILIFSLFLPNLVERIRRGKG
jgi:uncharacterized membrane protein YdjX (TVP38/TMEM64 family)